MFVNLGEGITVHCDLNMASLRSKDLIFPWIGKPRDKVLSQLQLPTSRDVLQRFLHYLKIENLSRSIAVQKTHEEIDFLWKKVSGETTPGYTCYLSKNAVKNKINKLWDTYKRIQKISPSNPKYKDEKGTFVSALDTLFDISKPDAKERLTDEDYKFLKDQQSNRKFTFGGKDTALQKRLLKKRTAEQAELERQQHSKEEMRYTFSSVTDTDITSTFYV